jgi:hypothetical protein
MTWGHKSPQRLFEATRTTESWLGTGLHGGRTLNRDSALLFA